MDGMAVSSYQLTFVGAGRMASAMIRSLLRSKLYKPEAIACCSAADGTAETLAEETGISIIDLASSMPFQTDTVVLACKPQQIDSVSQTVIDSSKAALVVSILAGTQLETLKQRFPNARNVVRVMPNTPGSIGEGMSGFAPSGSFTSIDRTIVETLLGSMGEYIEVNEPELDAVTAVSGSGPAYLFLFTETLIEAAKAHGFDDRTATLLAKQTIIGSAKLMEQSEFEPAELRKQVTSPNGTTQAALENFAANDLGSIVKQAVNAAYDRSIELGKGK